jgi:hypothetical protein
MLGQLLGSRKGTGWLEILDEHNLVVHRKAQMKAQDSDAELAASLAEPEWL